MHFSSNIITEAPPQVDNHHELACLAAHPPIYRACPLCLNDPDRQITLLIAWKLPLMLSCPLHGCWLESYWGMPGRFFGWENADTNSTHGQRRDCGDGSAYLAGTDDGTCRVTPTTCSCRIWFRLLRRLLDELNTPLSSVGQVHGVFAMSGNVPVIHFGRDKDCGVRMKYCTTTVQLQMLEAAATAIELIESNVLRPQGEQAELFIPEPKTGFTTGISVVQTKY